MLFLPHFQTMLCSLAGALSALTLQAEETNLFNLADREHAREFAITDRVWPTKVGEADICLWHDDKLAAFSFTIDDNWAPDIPWWREQHKKYGFHFTWFVITGRIDGGVAMWGTWREYQQLVKEGHAVESHTVTHLHPELPEWESVEWEYRLSKEQIENNIPGYTVGAIAYPGGKNSHMNDHTLAATMYRMGRGTRGAPNPVNNTEYMNTNGTGSLHLGEGGAWANLHNLLDPSLYRGLYYRGWGVYLAHRADRDKLPGIFEFLKENEDDIWVGLYTDVGKYGQQRDTATLTVTTVEQDRIELEVVDKMDDSYFDFPLSIKVRVPDNWRTIQAVQKGGNQIPARLIQHEGGNFALIRVVPDSGPVRLTSSR